MRVHQPTLRSYMKPPTTLSVLRVTIMLLFSNRIGICYRIYNSHNTSKDCYANHNTMIESKHFIHSKFLNYKFWIEYEVTGNSICI